MEDCISIYLKKIPEPEQIDTETVRTFPSERRELIFRKLENAAAGNRTAYRAAAEAYAAGLLLRDVLHVRKDEDLRTGENGKPYLADGSCRFSLSHSSSIAVLAAAPVGIGVDTEPVRLLSASLIRKVFTEEEKRFIEKDPVRNAVILWTRLEALVKRSGEGLAGLDKRTVSLLEPGEGMYFQTIETGDSFISTACEKELPVRWRDGRLSFVSL